MATDVLAIAFTPAPAADNPNSRVRADDDVFDTYYASMALAFASYRRFDPGLALELVSTTEPSSRWRSVLAGLGVGTRIVPFDHRPASAHLFASSLYTLDAIDGLARAHGPDARVLLVDPDTIGRRSLAATFDLVGRTGLLAYDSGLLPREPIQHLTPADIDRLHHELDPDLPAGCGTHWGGELYGFTETGAATLLAHADRAWRDGVGAPADGRMTTEEHVLSYALRHLSPAQDPHLIRRMWTAPRHRDVTSADLDLAIWHLPAEKGRGIGKLAARLGDDRSWVRRADDDEWRRRLAATFGVPRRRPGRWTLDTGAEAVRRVLPH